MSEDQRNESDEPPLSDDPGESRSMNASTSIKRLAWSSIIYAIGDLLTKFGRYLLIPICLAILDPEQIGMVAVLQAMTLVMRTTSNFAFGAAVRRFYYDDAGKANDAMVSTLWWTRLFGSLLLMTLLAPVVLVFGTSLFPALPVHLLLVVMLTGSLQGSFDTVESMFMIREMPVKYRAFTFSFFLLNTGVIATMLFALQMEIAGVVYGELIAASLWCALSGYLVTSRAKPRLNSVDWQRIREYCVPLAPHLIFAWLLAVGDRLILQHYVSSADVAVYEIGYLGASVVGIVMHGMHSAWIPDFFRTASTQSGIDRYARIADIVLLGVFSSSLVIVFFAADAVALVAGSDYSLSPIVTRIVMLGMLAQAIYFLFKNPLLYQAQTKSMLLFTTFGLTVNVTLNLILIPSYGIWGSAWATVLTYTSMAILVVMLGRRSLPIPWNWRRIIIISTISAIGISASGWITRDPGWQEFAIRLFACTLALVALMLGYAFTRFKNNNLATDSTPFRNEKSAELNWKA